MIPFIWIRTDTSGPEAIVRIADINLEPAAVYIRLVPTTGPDEDVRTRGTVRIMLTKVTGTSIIPFIRIRMDTSRSKIQQNNADLSNGNGKRVLLWDPEQFFGTAYIDQK